MLTSHLTFAHQIWKEHLGPTCKVIDATCGNGRDSLFLLECGIAHLYCIDIQKKALEITKEKLRHYKNFSLHLSCHSSFPMVQSDVDLIVYNLGYLPGGNKEITTQTQTSLKSIQSGLLILSEKGLISITLYPGHEEGANEQKHILEYASHLPKEDFQVTHHCYLNRNTAPSLLLIHKTPKCH